MSGLITCPICGQKNRVSIESNSIRQTCANCWGFLGQVVNQSESAPKYSEVTRYNHRKLLLPRLLWAVLSSKLCWLFLVILMFSYCVKNSHREKGVVSKTENKKDVGVLKPIALPKTGILLASFGQDLIAPFEVKTVGESSYFLKLIEWETKNTVLTIFLRAGEMLKVTVPVGKYEFRYASGAKWYGEKLLFGPTTNYSKANTPLEFKVEGSGVVGASITLYVVKNGNLRTSVMRPEEF